jgi:hypothetical protein
MRDFILPSHLLGRLYFLFALVVLEYVFCFVGRGAIPGHLKFYGMNTDTYGQIPIFAYLVFLGFGHLRLKAQQGEIPFGRVLFASHLLCLAAVFYLTMAAQEGLGGLFFYPLAYVKSAPDYSQAAVLPAWALFCWLWLVHSAPQLGQGDSRHEACYGYILHSQVLRRGGWLPRSAHYGTNRAPYKARFCRPSPFIPCCRWFASSCPMSLPIPRPSPLKLPTSQPGSWVPVPGSRAWDWCWSSRLSGFGISARRSAFRGRFCSSPAR